MWEKDIELELWPESVVIVFCLLRGQTDTFTMVSRNLGSLERCILGAMEREDKPAGADDRWHCYDVTVTNKQTGDRWVSEFTSSAVHVQYGNLLLLSLLWGEGKLVEFVKMQQKVQSLGITPVFQICIWVQELDSGCTRHVQAACQGPGLEAS